MLRETRTIPPSTADQEAETLSAENLRLQNFKYFWLDLTRREALYAVHCTLYPK